MAQLERSALAHFVDATPNSPTTWYRIGKDVESMSVELSTEVETKKNILDETSVKIKSYEPSMGVDTYYANPDDSIYPLVRDIAMGRKKGDDCKTKVLEVVIEDTEAASHLAYEEDAVIEVTSYGGEQGGVEIPFTVHFAGNRKKGTASISKGVPSFTAEE